MQSRGGSNYFPRAPPRLPGAFSSTLVDSEHPMSFILIRVQLSVTNSSQSYHGYRRSNIPSPQRNRKRRTVLSSVPIILNNSIRLSNRILAPGSANPTSRVALSGTMDNWIARQHTLLQVALAHQHQSDSHLLVEPDQRITEYPVHSYVLFTPPIGRGNKLLPKHRGPFQVMDKMDSIYVIEDLVSGKRITTHIHYLCPFIYDPIRTNPLTVAQHNEQEFIVESILGHRGNRNRQSTLQFYVR